MIKHNGPISGIACSNRFVATAGYDNQVILWDALSQTALARGLHDHLANRCEISQDERFLVTASSDYTARLWELPEMRLRAVYGDHADDVEMIRLSPSGRLVATTSQDGLVRVFTLGGQLLHRLEGHRGCVSSCTWSGDENSLVSCGDDGTVRVWDLTAGTVASVVDLGGVQTDSVVITAFGVIYAGNDQGEIVRIDGGDRQKITVHDSGVKNLVIDADEQRLISMSYDRTLALVDIQNNFEVSKKYTVPGGIWVRSCAFHSQERIVFGTFGSTYASLELASGIWDLDKVGATPCINSSFVDENRFYTVGDSGLVKDREGNVIADTGSLCNFICEWENRVVCGGHLGQVFDAETSEILFELNCPINKASAKEDLLVLALYSGEIAIIRLGTDRKIELLGLFAVLKNAVKDIAIHGEHVFCVGAASDIAIFDLQSLAVLSYRENAHGAIVNSCTHLGEGEFASVSRDLCLNIWRGVDLIQSIRSPHQHSIKCAATSAGSRYIATGAYDGHVAIFDRERKDWRTVRPTSAGISSITFGRGAFWASSYDGKIYELGVEA